jgi:chromosome partitioning protein
LHTIAITNIKGGSGKTTTAVSLADGIARRGRRVLLLDLDPQASASDWLLPDTEGPFAEEVLSGQASLAAAVRPTRVAGLDLLPASAHLAARARALAGEPAAELALGSALEGSAGWDYTLIDCPPELGLLTLNGLLAAGEVLVPVPPEPMAVNGLVRVLQTLELLARRYRRQLPIAAIVPVRVRPQTRLAQETLTALKRFPETFPGIVHETISVAEAPSHHVPLWQYRPGSTAAHDYEELTDHLLSQATGRRAA